MQTTLLRKMLDSSKIVTVRAGSVIWTDAFTEEEKRMIHQAVVEASKAHKKVYQDWLKMEY